jgi:hypothetical protein
MGGDIRGLRARRRGVEEFAKLIPLLSLVSLFLLVRRPSHRLPDGSGLRSCPPPVESNRFL